MKKFEVGKTYQTRSLCDYDSIYSFLVVRRTEKMVTILHRGKTVSRKVKVWDGVEHLSPLGRYSMSPLISADREIVSD